LPLTFFFLSPGQFHRGKLVSMGAHRNDFDSGW
jgi:hypothetical protein